MESPNAYFQTKLVRGATVTGRVVGDDGPVADVCPTAFEGRTTAVAFGPPASCTDATGTYTVTGLPPGILTLRLDATYDIHAAPTWYRKTAYQSAARLITTVAGRTQHLLDSALAPAGALSGSVVDAIGKPVANVLISLDGAYQGRFAGDLGPYTTTTDDDGHYAFSALPPESYRPLAIPHPGDVVDAPVWSGGSGTREGATPVNIRPGATTTRSFVLPAGGFVTGHVVDAGSAYLIGSVETTGGDVVGDFDVSPITNAFRTSPLAAGRYVLSVVLPDGTRAHYDGTGLRSSATPVSLAPWQTKDLSFHLP